MPETNPVANRKIVASKFVEKSRNNWGRSIETEGNLKNS